MPLSLFAPGPHIKNWFYSYATPLSPFGVPVVSPFPSILKQNLSIAEMRSVIFFKKNLYYVQNKILFRFKL